MDAIPQWSRVCRLLAGAVMIVMGAGLITHQLMLLLAPEHVPDALQRLEIVSPSRSEYPNDRHLLTSGRHASARALAGDERALRAK
jgi:hypothetical protein